MAHTTEADAVRALETLWSFWHALAADNDDLLPQLLAPCALDYLKSSSGVAGRTRQFLNVRAEDCLRIGTFSNFEILEGGDLLWRCLISETTKKIKAGSTIWAWRIEAVRTNSGWLVDPIRAATRPVIGSGTWDPPEARSRPN